MPFSILFTAEFDTGLLQADKHSYVVGINANREVTCLIPIIGSFHIVETALTLGFIDPREEAFWRNKPEPEFPWSILFASSVLKLCQKYLSFELVRPQALQSGCEVLFSFRNDNSDNPQFLFFPATVTELMSVESSR